MTTSSYSGSGTAGIWTTAVTVTLNATDALSGVKTTYYTLDGGAAIQYSGPFAVSKVGSHRLVDWSVDVAGNIETGHVTTFSIVSATTTTLSASPNPSSSGQTVTLTARVAAAIAGNSPTGPVAFYSGRTYLGGAYLLAGSASITTTSLATGTDHLFASYTPTVTGFQSSESASITQTVLVGTTVTLTNSPTSPVYGQSVTLTATVKSTSGGTPEREHRVH